MDNKKLNEMRERRDDWVLFDYMDIPYRNKPEPAKTTNVHWLQKLVWIATIVGVIYTIVKGII